MDLNQVTISCRSLDASIAFYRTLGLRLIVKNDHYARFELPKGNATLSLHTADTVTTGGILLYFEVEALDDEVRRLRERGIAVDAPIDQSWLWREAYLSDPSGHRLCLFHAGENRKNPPWRIAPA